MSKLRDVITKKERSEARRFEPIRDFVPAILVSVNGSVEVGTTKPNYVWAQEFSQPQSIFQVLNLAVKPIEGLPVKVGIPEKQPFIRQIVGIWEGIIYIQGYDPGNGTGWNLPNHGWTHEWPTEDAPGVDIVRTFQPAIQMFKTTGNEADYEITVQHFTYELNGKLRFYLGESVDLSPYLPVSGKRNVLVYLDKDTGLLAFSLGTTVPDVPSIFTPRPDIPAGAIPSAYVEVSASKTEVSTKRDIIDARLFFGNGGDGSLPDPDEWGQILFAITDAEFEKAIPMSTEDGHWMAFENGKKMVVG